MSQSVDEVSSSPAIDSSSGDAQRRALLQYVDQRIQQLEEERRELLQQASDLDAERLIILAKMAEAAAADPAKKGAELPRVDSLSHQRRTPHSRADCTPSLRPSPSFADNFARHFIESSAALQKKENNKMFRTLPRVAPRAMPVFAVTQALQTLPGWRVDGNETNCIEREFVFPDFVEAMKFMNAVAPVCESMQHHPCWENVYNRLKVKLCTHDAGNKVTEKDVALAKAMSETYARLHRKP